MKIKFFALAMLLSFIFYSCNSEKKQDVVKSETKQEQKAVKDHGQAGVAAVEGEQPNALQVAKSIEDFSTLVVAIEAAGVQDAVVNTGPLTILAPLNSAFDKLPEGTVETLLKPENKSDLAFILINHVAPANYPIKQLKKRSKKGKKIIYGFR